MIEQAISWNVNLFQELVVEIAVSRSRYPAQTLRGGKQDI